MVPSKGCELRVCGSSRRPPPGAWMEGCEDEPTAGEAPTTATSVERSLNEGSAGATAASLFVDGELSDGGAPNEGSAGATAAALFVDGELSDGGAPNEGSAGATAASSFVDGELSDGGVPNKDETTPPSFFEGELKGSDGGTDGAPDETRQSESSDTPAKVSDGHADSAVPRALDATAPEALKGESRRISGTFSSSSRAVSVQGTEKVRAVEMTDGSEWVQNPMKIANVDGGGGVLERDQHASPDEDLPQLLNCGVVTIGIHPRHWWGLLIFVGAASMSVSLISVRMSLQHNSSWLSLYGAVWGGAIAYCYLYVWKLAFPLTLTNEKFTRTARLLVSGHVILSAVGQIGLPCVSIDRPSEGAAVLRGVYVIWISFYYLVLVYYPAWLCRAEWWERRSRGISNIVFFWLVPCGYAGMVVFVFLPREQAEAIGGGLVLGLVACFFWAWFLILVERRARALRSTMTEATSLRSYTT